MKEHVNFDLRLDFRPEGVRSAANCPDSGGEASGEVWDGSLLEELRSFSPGVSGQSREVLQGGLIPSRRAEEVGADLFRALFSGGVQRLWSGQLARAKAEGRDVRLRIHLGAPELSGVPWEVLFDPENGFLALSRRPRISIVRYLDLETESRPLLWSAPIRILVIVAQPRGEAQLGVEEEWRELKQGLACLWRLGLVRLKRLDPPTLSHLSEVLTRETFHVVHFIGHGGFDPTAPEGMLFFESDGGGGAAVNGLRLGAVLEQQESPGLVVLNACEGAREGAAPFAGVAQSLVRQQIPAVVAMQHPVRDRDAIRFSRRFYGELVRSGSVDSALSRARIGWMADSPGSDWSTPVLYMRSPTGFKRDGLPVKALLLIAFLLILTVFGFGSLREPDRVTEPPPPPSPIPLDISTEGCPPSDLLGMKFVRIEPRPFQMGSKRWAKDERRHEVRISKPFCMGVYEVTQGEWEALMGPAPGTGPRDSRLPVTSVSPLDAAHFIEALNKREPGVGYRLPTEAQWEYAARAGASTRFSFGDNPAKLHLHGNCKNREVNDGFDGLALVGSFERNPLGLYDMHGNVSEWVEDWYGYYPKDSQTDPKGPETGTLRVRRGGSFNIIPKNCDAVRRTDSEPNYRSDDVGFRLVKPVVQEGT